MVHLAAKDGTAMPPLEKPQQILPCPRCESMNTKFCYFNNYSVNQPRHFCKQCQRYWTVGGTLRNVPVGGASRKKNRHPTSPQDQHLQQQPYMRSSAPPHPGQLQPVFQQMLTHDMSGPGFNFSQLPGFVPHSQEMHVQQPFSSTPAPQEFVPPLGSVSSNYNYFQEPGSVLHGEQNGVKPEFWSSGHMQVDSGSVQTGSKSGGYDSSMLLHMGLNSRPLMEEERSVPGNGYSNGGFQEGDTVSGSMWHGVQDMQEFYR